MAFREFTERDQSTVLKLRGTRERDDNLANTMLESRNVSHHNTPMLIRKCPLAPIAPVPVPAFADEFEAIRDFIRARMAERQVPSFAVALARDGKILGRRRDSVGPTAKNDSRQRTHDVLGRLDQQTVHSNRSYDAGPEASH